jgi:hypothetical protein
MCINVRRASATFGTWAYDTAAARPDVIEACLAHREAAMVKAAFNRAHFTDERRALLAAWAEYLAQPAAAVIPLRAARCVMPEPGWPCVARSVTRYNRTGSSHSGTRA